MYTKSCSTGFEMKMNFLWDHDRHFILGYLRHLWQQFCKTPIFIDGVIIPDLSRRHLPWPHWRLGSGPRMHHHEFKTWKTALWISVLTNLLTDQREQQIQNVTLLNSKHAPHPQQSSTPPRKPLRAHASHNRQEYRLLRLPPHHPHGRIRWRETTFGLSTQDLLSVWSSSWLRWW